MIAITDRACRVLLHLRMSAEPAGPEVGLRLIRGDAGQLELFADTERDGDRVVEREGVKLLLIAGEVLEDLAGSTIDCRATAGGLRLVLEEPAAHSGGNHGGNGGPPHG